MLRYLKGEVSPTSHNFGTRKPVSEETAPAQDREGHRGEFTWQESKTRQDKEKRPVGGSLGTLKSP